LKLISPLNVVPRLRMSVVIALHLLYMDRDNSTFFFKSELSLAKKTSFRGVNARE